MGKSQIKSHSKISNPLHWSGDSNLQAKSLILNRISYRNLESSNSKSRIKSQIPKQQKGFSKHISMLLVISLISINIRQFVNVSSADKPISDPTYYLQNCVVEIIFLNKWYYFVIITVSWLVFCIIYAHTPCFIK